MRQSLSEKIGNIIMHVILAVYAVICIYPFVLTFIVSISSERSVVTRGYQLIPEAFSLSAYTMIFENGAIFQAYLVTIFVTAVGTALSLLLTGLAGYAMSVKKVKYRNAFAMFFFIPTVFNAGLVPWYLVCTQILMFRNNIHALIVPGLVSTFNIFLARNYFKTIPESLVESAEIDGASIWKTFFKIILPVSTPIIATISLFVALGYWNDWSNALWFIDERNLFPLQYFLFRVKNLMEMIRLSGGMMGTQAPDQTFQIAMLFVTIGPIIFLYPFVQRYFLKGIMVGAVKG